MANHACTYIKLNDLNEVVNFHFTVSREAKECEACGSSGYAPQARQVSEDFYDFANTGRKWNGDITLDEAQHLVDNGRLRNWDPGTRTWVSEGKVTPGFLERVNRANDPNRHRPKVPALFLQAPPDHSHLLVVNPEAMSYPWGPATIQWDSRQVQEDRCNLTHDAINRIYLIRKRCERLGYTVSCPECGGDGYVHTAEKAHLGVVLWLLHPRKGASRGVEVKHVSREELPQVLKFLKRARTRFLENFRGLDLPEA